jgi:poly(hydroxyalkanoate) depolymerase family esterase
MSYYFGTQIRESDYMKLQNLLKAVLISLISVTGVLSTAAHAGSYTKGQYTGLSGSRNFKFYMPENPTNKKIGLVVMLHGCQQTADEFATSSKILIAAEKYNFAVLLPEQAISNNSYKCWNWILPAYNSRLGESEIIMGMVDQVIKNHNLDSNKVYAAGMSAGASMAGILGNCYPERFKAIASHDGVQYYPTAIVIDYVSVVLNGADIPAEQAGATGYAQAALFNPPKQMPVIIFQGMASPYMNPLHANQVEDEFKVLNDYLDDGLRDLSAFKSKNIETVPDSETYGYTKYSLTDKSGNVYIERYMINRLSHAWSGGDGKYQYNDPNGPDATTIFVKFFKRFGL